MNPTSPGVVVVFVVAIVYSTETMVKDRREAVIQLLYSYPDEIIDRIADFFDEEFDFILETYDRPTRYTLLAEEMMDILQNDTASIDVVVAIFRRHGIRALRVPNSRDPLRAMPWGEISHGCMKLGPIFVSLGGRQQHKEEDEIINAAESLWSIRLSVPKLR